MTKVEHTTADGRQLCVTVFEASVRHNLIRTRRMRDCIRDRTDKQDVLEDLIRFNTYPACIAASKDYSDSGSPEHTVEEMTYEQFLDIPDMFMTKWAEAVFKLNPGWSAAGLVPQETPSSSRSVNR